MTCISTTRVVFFEREKMHVSSIEKNISKLKILQAESKKWLTCITCIPIKVRLHFRYVAIALVGYVLSMSSESEHLLKNKAEMHKVYPFCRLFFYAPEAHVM